MTIRLISVLILAALALPAQGPFAAKKRSTSTTSTQQHPNVDKLQADLAALLSKSQVTPAMKQQLANDLMAMCDGATKPSQASVQKLADDLSAALADKKISQRELAKLTADLQAVLNSANISMDEFTAVVNDAKTILTASGVSKADVQMIVADLQAIGAELKKHVPSTTAPAASAPARKFPRK